MLMGVSALYQRHCSQNQIKDHRIPQKDHWQKTTKGQIKEIRLLQ